MRILYDGYIYGLQSAGGINRYFSNLIGKLPESFQPVLSTCRKHEVNFPTHPNLKVLFYQRFGFRPGRVSYWLEQYYFRYAAARTPADVVHPTYYETLTREPVGRFRRPVVITVHDMIHERFPEQLDPGGEQAEQKRKAVMAAQAIICVSENTRRDLLESYPRLEGKVSVIHSASEIDESLSHGPEAVPARPYYVYVGSREHAYKNFNGLLSAFAKVASDCPDLALCVVGPPLSRDEERLIAEFRLEGKVECYVHVGDEHLAKLYRNSIALVYPSLYEGFGLPLLEAMACGTAVVASDRSSIPEVVGDAGLLFDPGSKHDLADALLHLHRSPAQRRRLVDRGRQRVKEFSWDKTAGQTTDVYRSVAARAA